MIRIVPFLLALLAAHPAFAQSPDETANRNHFFPLVVDGGGFQSFFFLSNAADAANECALDLHGRGLDPSILLDFQTLGPPGPVETVSLAGADASRTLITVGAQPPTVGYATLACDGPVVARMMINLSEFGLGPPIAATAVESAQLATQFQFPVLAGLGSLGLAFSNDAGLDASCAVELEDSDGAAIGGASVAVAAQSTAVQFLDEIIPLPDGFTGGSVTAACSGEVAALALPFSSPAFAAFRAAVPTGDDTAKPRHVLPLVVDGDGFQSRVLVTNLAPGANRCAMDLFGAGLDTGRFESAAGVTAADSSASLNLAGPGDDLSLVSAGNQPLAFGYATIDCDGPVVARNLLTANVQGEVAGMAVIPGSQEANVFRFPVPPQAGGLALVLANDASSDASCAVVLEHYDGERVTRGPIAVPGKSAAVRFLGDLFEFLEFFTEGWATVSCVGNVTAVSLPRSGAVFAAIPPAIVSISSESDSSSPIFPHGSSPGDLRFVVGELDGVELPVAIGGVGTLTYSLEPTVPGMSFDAGAKLYIGAPAMIGEYELTYTVMDESGGADLLEFTLTVEEDTVPSLAGVSLPENLRFMLGEEIEPVTFPEATGGNAPLFYYLAPRESGFRSSFVPGLFFDSESRQLGGAPTEPGVYNLEYSVIDGNLDMDSVEVTITAVAPVTAESLIDAAGCTDGGFIDSQDSSSALTADCRALAGFANALIETGLNAEDSVIRQWGKGERVRLDTWDGIGVADGRVTRINLESRDLKGGLPPQLAQLGALEYLSLENNELTGEIPPELGGLSVLESLLLTSNRLSGPIPPELSGLEALTVLDLGGNELEGTIPPALGNLGSLEHLSLWGNRLHGAIPAELGNLSNLQELTLSLNELSGAIPPELGQLAELTVLDLHFNDLTGAIPAQFGQLLELRQFHLGFNRLSGPVPAELARLSNLWILEISDNELNGPIPPELGQLENLERLDLSYNQLSGAVPDELAQLDKLKSLNVEFNRLTGVLPWGFRERMERGDLALTIVGNQIGGFGATPMRPGDPVYSADPAENGNASHHSISWFQGPLVMEWDWSGERIEHQTPILGRGANLAVSIDHEVPYPPLVITRVLDSRDETLVERLEETAPPTTEETASGHWRTEYVFRLPGELFQAGNRIVHVIDPDDKLAETNEEDNVAEPIVLSGEAPPGFRATFIPIQSPGEEEWYRELDPDLLMQGTLAKLPIADDYEARIGPALESDSDDIDGILAQLVVLWNREADPDEFYHAITENNLGGVALLSSQVAVSPVSTHTVIPHEFGHNLSLLHTPGCTAAGADENYPYPDGRLGSVRGWDPSWRIFVSGENERYADVMSYCGDFHHISDYHYRLASEYWLSVDSGSGAASPPGPTGEGASRTSTAAVSSAGEFASLALSGRVSAGGDWSLSQTQLSEREPRPAPQDGEFTLVLFDSAGVQVYAEPLAVISSSEGDDSFWAARTPLPLRTAQEIAILDAQGNELLRETLPESAD